MIDRRATIDEHAVDRQLQLMRQMDSAISDLALDLGLFALDNELEENDWRDWEASATG